MNAEYLKKNKMKFIALAVLVVAAIAVFLLNPFGDKAPATPGGPGTFAPPTVVEKGKTLTPQEATQKADQVIREQQEQAAERIKKKKPTGGS